MDKWQSHLQCIYYCIYYWPINWHLGHRVFKIKYDVKCQWTWCLCDRASSVQRRNNQQDVTTFSFINLFKSAQNVSGDKFAHFQEHSLTLYTDFGTMHRHCCRPVPRLRWNSSISTVAPVGSRGGALYQKLYIVKKCSWWWANLLPETCWADLNRLINEKVVNLFGCLHRWKMSC